MRLFLPTFRSISLIVLSLSNFLNASWSPIPPNFPYPPGPPIGWPVRMGPPQGPPPNFFRQPAPMPFPMPSLSDFSGFSPIGFEYPSQEELLQMEREKKLRKEKQRAEKLKSIGKRNEDQRSNFATTTTDSNDQKTSTESYSTASNSFEDKTRFDDSKNPIKMTDFDKLKEDRIKSFYRPSDLKEGSKNDGHKKPLDVKRKQTINPNGEVTFITEMLYDIEGGNPFKPTTSPPSASSPYLPPTTDGMYNPTDDPRLMTQTAHPYTTYLPGTLPRPGESDNGRWHLMPTPPTPFRSSSSNKQQQYAEKSDTISSRVAGSHQYQGHNNHHHRHRGASSNLKGSSTNRRDGSSKSVTEAQGLGAAAIAGIVIGSLVSVALLAGNQNFSVSTTAS